jgi:GR25 family glycosyltransferase involved in LPS biosynthesis
MSEQTEKRRINEDNSLSPPSYSKSNGWMIAFFFLIVVGIAVYFFWEFRVRGNYRKGMVSYSGLGNKGRLGNQLFQISAVLGVAKSNNLSAVFYVRNQWRSDKYFKQNLIYDNIMYDPSLRRKSIPEENPIGYSPIFTHEKTNTLFYIEGYRQSEQYFSHIREEILNHFTPTDEIRNRISSELTKITGTKDSTKWVGVHIRLGDYEKQQEFHVCEMEYYGKAIHRLMMMDGSTKELKLILFSDDIVGATKKLKDILPPSYPFCVSPFAKENEIYDLFALSSCKYQILSNSTFSWWASYFNRQAGSRQIAPTPWFNPEKRLARYNENSSVHRPRWEILNGQTGAVIHERGNDATFLQMIYRKSLSSNKITLSLNNSVPVFIISMKEDRLQNCIQQLSKIGIQQPNHFQACVGKEMDKAKLVKYGLISPYFDFGCPTSMIPGTIGCLLSHISIYQWLLDSHYEHALIFEDDVVFDRSVTNDYEIPQYIQRIISSPSNWGIAYLGSCLDSCHFYVPVPGYKRLVETKRSGCTHAYLISRFGAGSMLAELPLTKAIDSEIIDITARRKTLLYATNPAYFYQDNVNFTSDIRGFTVGAGNNFQCNPIAPLLHSSSS